MKDDRPAGPGPGADPEDTHEDPVARVEREEFARGHIEPGEDPVEPRPAATVVVARPGSGGGFEVLLLRRPDTSRFAAGAYAFPGGVIDPGDADPRLVPALPGSVPSAARPALAAALRELFEETGLLPCDRPPPEEDRRRVRGELLADRLDFAGTVSELGLTFHGLQVAYFARWITPARLRRRYDARFFLAAHRRGEPELTEEHTGHLWAAPARGLARFRAGELPMLFPTWKTLEMLAGHAGLEPALERLAEGDVATMRPRLVVEGGRVRPVMPGDPGYDDAALSGGGG